MTIKKGTNKSETLKGTDGDESLLGRSGNDTLLGGDGNDRLNGGKGDDELLGGAGNDVLLPGKGGADAMDGGKGIDTVSYANFVPSAPTGVTVQLNALTESPHDDAEGDTYLNVERFIGTSSNDYFYVYRHDVPGGYYVDGGNGNDFMRADGGIMRGGQGKTIWSGDSDREFSDTFWLDLGSGVDTFGSFDCREDKLRISGKEFGVGSLLNSDELIYSDSVTPIGTKAQFIFQDSQDRLYFDADGTGSEVAVLLVKFESSSLINSPAEANFEIV